MTNQLTVEEMGWLLEDIYQCGYENSGPLMQSFGGQYESRECRQMLHVMSNNTVDALLKAGVPADTRVAHKLMIRIVMRLYSSRRVVITLSS
jgi:hypothetical protein